MRLPGGAVLPAIKPTIGFLIFECLINSAASSSLLPPISPKIRIDLNHIENQWIQIQKNKQYKLGFSKANDLKIDADIKFKKIDSKKSFVKIDDGKISFEIIDKKDNNLILKALDDGLVQNRKGINFPGVTLDVRPLTYKDKEHLLLAIRNDVDLTNVFIRLESIFQADEGTPEAEEMEILVNLIEAYVILCKLM